MLEELEREARQGRKSLWAAPQPVLLWEWQHVGPLVVDVGDLMLGEHVTIEEFELANIIVVHRSRRPPLSMIPSVIYGGLQTRWSRWRQSD